MMKAGNFGTFSEVCGSAELYGFHDYIFQRSEAKDFMCYEFGTTDYAVTTQNKPRWFLLFTGSTDSGHLGRLESSIARSTVQAGKYMLMDRS